MSIALQALVALAISAGAFAATQSLSADASTHASTTPPAPIVAGASADTALDAHAAGGVSLGL